MEIIVNGEQRQVPNSYTAAQLVEAMGLSGERIAMEVNLEIVPHSTYESHVLQPGDRIEVVHAVGGG